MLRDELVQRLHDTVVGCREIALLNLGLGYRVFLPSEGSGRTDHLGLIPGRHCLSSGHLGRELLDLALTGCNGLLKPGYGSRSTLQLRRKLTRKVKPRDRLVQAGDRHAELAENALCLLRLAAEVGLRVSEVVDRLRDTINDCRRFILGTDY